MDYNYTIGIVIGLVVSIIFCFLVAKLWDNKGHSYAGGFWLSFFLTPILGLIIGLIMQDAKKPDNRY